MDCTKAVQPEGHSLIKADTLCFLCGGTDGLKMKCAHKGCCYFVDGKLTEATFHVTCARQAGFEVNTSEGAQGTVFYSKYSYAFGATRFTAQESHDL